MNIPNHVAIIPDGNRRWAKEKGKNTYDGHKKGFEQLIKIAKKARNLGIKVFTVWAFSTENWKRSKEEVNYLMKLYEIMLDRYLSEALKDKVRIIHLGRKDRINNNLRNKIIDVEGKTKKFDKSYLCIALDYGGRDEIVRGIRSSKSAIEELNFNQYLDTKDLPFPDPDLIIRTGGEQRISGFMLWQSQYSELVFEKKYLPDYSDKDFENTITEYSKRQRRFGK
ncbi:MAG: polyprenyl diphosphate synthase [Patescibacteria group bacterium]|jgi:undecaprenyl diphosphate synthase